MPTQTLHWNKLIAQDRVKSVLNSAFQNGTLGHAYLFCGGRGTGKFAAALDLAMAVLCRNEGARPCGECMSCKKAGAYSHPDFHVIMPLVLDAEHKKDGGFSEKGWQYAAEQTKRRIEDPYKLPEYDSIPSIPVDWIREANHAIQRGGTAGDFNVAIIDGVDLMRAEPANAMLKTLEEPPAGTVMILLSDRPHSLLPTIVSRCQIIRFASLPPDAVRTALSARFGAGVDDPRIALAAAGGSLGAAIEEFESSQEEYFEIAAGFWNDCMRGDWEGATRTAERTAGGKEAFAECQKTLKCMIELLRFAFLSKYHVPVNYFKYNIELPERVVPDDVDTYIRLCQEALTDLNARGNSTMIMVNLACTLIDTLTGRNL